MQADDSTDSQHVRNRNIAIGVLMGYFAVAGIVQCCLGNITPTWWAFPMNVAVVLVLLIGLLIVWREAGYHLFVQFLASGKCSVLALIFIGIACLIKGLVPPAAAKSAWCVRLGLHDFTSSWIFAFCIILLVSNLWLVVVRRSTNAPHAWRFALNHIGVLITIVSLFFGAADTHKWHIVAQQGVPTDMAYDATGTPHGLGYSITLDTFAITRFDNGQPAAFQADVAIDGNKHTIRVNAPLRHTWCEDIYLTDYNMTNYGEITSCVLESVVQPWKYITLVGIIMMICGALLLFFDGRTHQPVSHPSTDRP
ncbi:MAG: cytochrome c biogenesis protein ResB [Paludibacteraceae bacterium]